LRSLPNKSLKLTRLSPRLYLGGWGEAVAVNGRFQAKPPRSLAPPLGQTLRVCPSGAADASIRRPVSRPYVVSQKKH